MAKTLLNNEFADLIRKQGTPKTVYYLDQDGNVFSWPFGVGRPKKEVKADEPITTNVA